MIRHRYRRIVGFFARILLGFAFWDLLLPRLGMRKLSRRTFSRRVQRSAAAFRALAVEMGGVLIKVGQFLSSRVDVLPPEIIDELVGLQDEVPPERFVDILSVIEDEFGTPLEDRYDYFEEEPLAAASLGQVHRAHLKHDPEESQNGVPMDVVVKIQRPDIRTIIATDLLALNTVGRWLQRYKPISQRADVPALLGEFSTILYQEIDYLAEGGNAEIFADNFKNYPGVRVPKVIWSHTTTRVLTLENVWGIKITDYPAITAAGIDREQVAIRLLDTYLKQIFEDGFFHADPHPGNLFVYKISSPEQPEDEELAWVLTFVDFGMVGQVPSNTKDGLREMLIGVGTQDAARVVKAYQMLNVLLPSADLDLIERIGAQAFSRFWGKSMDELRRITPTEIRAFTSEFRDLIYSMPFQVPQNFIFLARAVGILSGMCTGLDPEFNVWEHLAPYAEKLIREEMVGSSQIWLDEIKRFVGVLLAVPVKMELTLDKLERGQIVVQTPQASNQIKQLEGALRQVAGSIMFAASLLGGIQLFLAGESGYGLALLIVSGLSILWVVISGRRT